MSCPSEETLAAFLDGRLEPDEQAALDAHLGGCGSCARLFALAAGDEREPSPGARIGRYQVRAPIGAGGMGVVYAAYDPELGRPVALKLLHSRPGEPGEARARLLREAQAMARLLHPNVVAVHDAGAFGDQVFIAMDLVEGGTLAQWRKQRPRGWREIREVFESAGRGLAAAHAAGIVHRDFKPENVLIGSDGKVRVTDFGLARLAEDPPAPSPAAAPASSGVTSLTRSGALLGSPGYMAPEQLRGGVADARSDVFSFCVALHECLGGERPFAGATLEELRRSVERGEVRKLPRQVPAFLRRLLERGLSARPEDRYPSMEALLGDLGKRPTRIRPWLAGAALAALALALGLRAPPREWRAQVEPLALYEENAEPPALSPDGTLLAYASDRGDRRRWQLFVEPLSGGEARALTPPGPRPHCARFTRDGKALVYVDESRGEARRLPLAGGPAELVAAHVQCVEDCGARGMLLERGGADDCPTCERIVLLAPGGERELARLVGKHARPLRCDRQGERYVLAAVGPGGASQLLLGDLAGGVRSLLESEAPLADPVFAADGRSVIYGAEVAGRMNLFELPLAGGTPLRLTDGPGSDLGPEPTPDGRSLLFELDNTPRLLLAIDLQSGRSKPVSARLQELRNAIFTLDGRALVAQVQRQGATQIAELPLDGSPDRVIVSGSMPDLTADDREIVYAHVGAGVSGILAVARAGGTPRRLAEVEGDVHDLIIGADGRVHLRVDRGQRRFALSVPLSGGAPALDAPEPWSVVVPLAGAYTFGLRAAGYYDEAYLLPPGVAPAAGPVDPAIRRLPARLVTVTRGQRALVYADGQRIVDLTPGAGEKVLYEYALPSEFNLSPDGRTLLLGVFVGAVQRQIIRNFADRPR